MQLSVWWMFLITFFSTLTHFINGVTFKALNEIKDGLNVTLQCESNVEELTFTFLNYTDFAASQIGECKFRKHRHCMFYDKNYLAWFDIKQTSSTGELTLVNLTRNQYGRYTCLETYRPYNNDTIEVNGSATVRKSKSSNMNVVIILCACCGGVLIPCVFVIYCLWKKYGSHEPSRNTQLDIDMSNLNQTTEPLMGQCSGMSKSVASLAEIYGGQSNQYR